MSPCTEVLGPQIAVAAFVVDRYLGRRPVILGNGNIVTGLVNKGRLSLCGPPIMTGSLRNVVGEEHGDTPTTGITAGAGAGDGSSNGAFLMAA